MLGEAALKGFIPAAVMPERPSFSREGTEKEGVPREPRERLQWEVRAYRELKSRRFERP